MRKLLLLLLTFNLGVNAQVLSLDDHSNLTIGNIGTDLTGVVPGQDGYRTRALSSLSVNSNSDFQVVDKGGVYGNALQVIGPNASNSLKFLNKTNLPTLWSTRTIGNDIIEVEVDIFTGPASTSRNSIRINLYSDEAVPKIISGIGFAKNASYISGTAPNQILTNYTNLITGYGYATNVTLNGTITGVFIHNGNFLGSPTPQITIADDSWIKIGFSYNKLTGQTKWKGAGINGSNTLTSASSAINLTPGKLEIYLPSGNFSAYSNGTPPVILFPAIPNAASATFAFDNIKISATSVDNLLGSDSFDELKDGFKVFPNPANSIISISNTENATINKISITDVNERIVKTENFVNISDIEVNVSDLNNGLYFMNIYSENGLTTKKIIKN